ncbi:LytTR family two component transcriptional regulator [Maribacter vaceletii]|uniref:LytTR family two component transcriptional regulator n=1 Tax=Maribacter vaceletii TaxID=1206816 RepID=A0A495DUC3_9FLAO|nr:LytTR family DNA-binding domain-containing protein [Maribacter vaceletii]RKR08048.1 LytTR family two component transcriptional regulator [Maribacter vaceletii]
MRCLIVDDDPLVCDLLEHFCSKLNMGIEATIATSGFESINLINQSNFDFILLDYDLPDITGKEILSIIKEDTSVIMITSNKDFGHESYNYNQIVDFLLKPIEYLRFCKSIEKIKKSARPKDHFFLKDGTGLTKVLINDLLYIKSAGNYLEFVMPNKKVMTIMTVKDVLPKLTSSFQRTHRSYIVNMNKVEKVTTNGINIRNSIIPLSKTFETSFMLKLNLLN